MANDYKGEVERLYFTQVIIVLTLLAVVFGLGAISLVSLFQTEKAFQPMNDPSIIILGINIGAYISVFFALIAQYTQNVALYIGKHYCTGKVVFESELPIIGEVVIVDKALADGAFWVSAIIDALTNIVWFYTTVSIPTDFVLGAMLRIIGYTGMLASVFVEEAIGIVMDALRKATRQLKDISAQEKRMRLREKANGAKQIDYTSPTPKSYSENNVAKTNNRSEFIFPRK
jgi:hypothetical protein